MLGLQSLCSYVQKLPWKCLLKIYNNKTLKDKDEIKDVMTKSLANESQLAEQQQRYHKIPARFHFSLMRESSYSLSVACIIKYYNHQNNNC